MLIQSSSTIWIVALLGMGQSNGKQDPGSASGQASHNGKAKEGSSREGRPTLGDRRTSFYETVDASEILPHLIIGEKGVLTTDKMR